MYKKVWIFLAGVAIGQEMMYRYATDKSMITVFVEGLKENYNARK